ncbi:MAG: phosphoribosylanthranilate isomerase [Hyphomicrobiales bacterium]
MTTLVKICGLSTPETLDVALEAGADFVGLVFYPKSPRNVLLKQAAGLAQQLRAHPESRARLVALVVDAEDGLLTDIAAAVRPDLFQLHGAETPERLARIKPLTGSPAYKALRVRTPADLAKAKAYASPFILYDALAPEGALPGGNGLSFDWTILKDAARPFMLAGGLTPDNVEEAIRVTGAAMVDVSSGVESAPGIKDPARIRKFIEAVKASG